MPIGNVRIVISAPADRDLGISGWRSPPMMLQRQLGLVRDFGAKIRLLAAYPRLGPRCHDIRSGTRVLVEGPYLILYETHQDTDDGPIDEVEVVRVVDGRRDLTSPF